MRGRAEREVRMERDRLVFMVLVTDVVRVKWLEFGTVSSPKKVQPPLLE